MPYVSGALQIEVDPTGTIRKHQMILCVRDVEIFMQELKKIVSVMMVQLS